MCLSDFGRWFRGHAAWQCRPPPNSARRQGGGNHRQDHRQVPRAGSGTAPAHTSKAFSPSISNASEESKEKPAIPYNMLPALYWRRKISGPLWPKTLKRKVGCCHCLSAELQQWANWGQCRLFLFFPPSWQKGTEMRIQRWQSWSNFTNSCWTFSPKVDLGLSVKVTSLRWFYHLLPGQHYPPLGSKVSCHSWITVTSVSPHCNAVIHCHKDIPNLALEKLTRLHTLTLTWQKGFYLPSHQTMSVVLPSVSMFLLSCGHLVRPPPGAAA